MNVLSLGNAGLGEAPVSVGLLGPALVDAVSAPAELELASQLIHQLVLSASGVNLTLGDSLSYRLTLQHDQAYGLVLAVTLTHKEGVLVQ